MKKTSFLILMFAIAFTGSAQTNESGSDIPALTEASPKVKVFPNPATNVVNVLGLTNASKADIAILDIYGNTRLRYEWAIRRNALNIPISELESGAYIIHIHSEAQHLRAKFYKK